MKIRIIQAFFCLALVSGCGGQLAAQQTLELQFAAEDGTRTSITVAEGAEKLHLSKRWFLDFGFRSITSIEGIERLTAVKTVILSVVPMFADFDWLARLPNLENLYIHTSSVRKTEFLEDIPTIRIVVITETMEMDPPDLDLKNNQRLEYLAFHFTNLDALPRLRNIPESFAHLDLEYNQIERIRAEQISEEIKKIPFIFFAGNPIEPPLSALPNAVFTPAQEIIGDRYIDAFR